MYLRKKSKKSTKRIRYYKVDAICDNCSGRPYCKIPIGQTVKNTKCPACGVKYLRSMP